MNRFSSFVRFMMVAGIVATTWTAAVQAAPISLTAYQAQSPESTFTLSFGGEALPSSFISNTAFVLNIDDQPTGTGAANFSSYYQEVAPLLLPDGQGGYVDTGDLTVEIILGSSGASSYDPETGLFSTTETYRIHYTGDLRPIGLEDGGFVEFPSTSSGIISFDANDPSIGTIAQNWTGHYAPLGIDYSCSVHMNFPEPSALALLGLAGLVLRRRGR